MPPWAQMGLADHLGVYVSFTVDDPRRAASVAAALGAAAGWWLCCTGGGQRPPTMLDEPTLKLLASAKQPDPRSAAVSAALNTAELLDDEAGCAEQMRAIIKSNVLPYKALVDDPGTLLAASSDALLTNGALWTRFTVSYNLYAGSVVALGNDEQRQQLFDSQPAGQLGCFAFTEKGAGVLSGAAVETTATYDPATQTFDIHRCRRHHMALLLPSQPEPLPPPAELDSLTKLVGCALARLRRRARPGSRRGWSQRWLSCWQS